MKATHRCKTCNSKWARADDGSWSLVWGSRYNGRGGASGPCCETVKGAQIVPWTAPPGPPDPPAPPPGRKVA